MVRLLRTVCVLGASLMATYSMAGELEELMRQCAPEVHPTTLSAIVRQESLGRAYAISDDGPATLPWKDRKEMLRSFRPSNKTDAARIAQELVDDGHLVGIGLTQISHRNLRRFGISVADALEPCTNLKYGAKVLLEYYLAAKSKFSKEQDALLAAISAYNTNSFERGFANGYVSKVANATQYTIPAIDRGQGGVITSKLIQGKKTPVRLAAPRPSTNEAQSRLLAAKFSSLEVQSY